MKKKYKLLAAEMLVTPGKTWKSPVIRKFYRIKALRHIPRQNVRRGQLGGYVSNPSILDQRGDAWIGDGAYVYGNVSVSGNAHIKDNAVVINLMGNSQITIMGDAIISDDASVVVTFPNDSQEDPKIHTMILGKSIIGGRAFLHNCYTIEDPVIVGNVRLYRTTVKGETLIEGNAKTLGGNSITDSCLRDDAVMQINSRIARSTVEGQAIIGEGQHIRDMGLSEKAIYTNEESPAQHITITKDGKILKSNVGISLAVEEDVMVEASTGDDEDSTTSYFKEIKAKIAAYETDIVKIIKYPLMTDGSYETTALMVKALNKANRLSTRPERDKFEEAVEALEMAFIAAESQAIKVASTMLTEAEMKRTAKATDMLSIAANEASSETEKKNAFTQAFKQLEGVIMVPEVAITTFRAKVGLQELESAT